MTQSRRMSLIEAATNVIVGYGVAVAATWVILPWFGHKISAQDTLSVSAVFTAVSLLRSYLLRRLFNAILP